jgi:hypothetical protein
MSDWKSIAYAVMSNHIHHALVAGRDPLRSWLGEAHGPFAEWINERQQRIGAVFVRGPNVIGIQPAGVASVVAYIHRNPVRAGVVAMANDTSWTSHRGYLDPSSKPAWLDTTLGMELMRFADPGAMDTWVNATPIDREQLDAFRIEARNPVGRPRIEATSDACGGELLRAMSTTENAKPA